jgi:hypothetical protein
MAATKLTREQMIEKLMSLHVGVKVRWQNKTYIVMSVEDCGGKLCRRDVSWLEEGKDDVYYIPGKYLAAGKMIECTNRVYRSLLARSGDMDFEIVTSEAAA